MTLSLDDFQALKRQVEELTRRRDEAKGAFAQVMKDIKKEFGCTTLKAAKKLLRKLQKDERVAYRKYTLAKTAFEEKWKDILNGKEYPMDKGGRISDEELVRRSKFVDRIRARLKKGKGRKVGTKKAS